MLNPEHSSEKNTILEAWKLSQLSTILEPKSLHCTRFFVSIDYPKHSPSLFGYIELEPLIKGSGGLHIPFRLSENNPLSRIAASNAEALNKMNADLGNTMSISHMLKKPQIDSHDLVDMYNNLGFPTTYDNEKGFWPMSVKGFTFSFDSVLTGDISAWIYKFRNPLTDEIPFSARFEPNNPVWGESAQKFSTAINTALPLIVRPAHVQKLQR